MDGAFYCRSELRARWGRTLPPLPGYLWFHVLTAGAMLLEAGGHTRTLAPGEHVGARYEVLRHGGDGAPATLPCGAVRFGHPAAAALIGVLPAIVHLGAERVERTLALMAAEARESVRG